jgi:tetratricopeptide (TPR) repeat protein
VAFAPSIVLVLALAVQAPASTASSEAAPWPASSSASDSATATGDLGRAYYLFLQGLGLEGQDDAAAIVSFRQALAIAPDAAAIHAELAGIFARQGQMTDAAAEAKRALDADPDNRTAHRLLGWIEAGTIRPDGSDASTAAMTEAIGHLEKAVAGNVDDPAAELVLSDLYLRTHQGAKAITRLKHVLDDRPDYAPAQRMLVSAYETTGDVASADAARDALDRSAPDTVGIRVRQIGQLEAGGDWKTAASAWADIVNGEAGGDIYRPRLAAALANNGDIDGARRVLADLARDWPKDVSGWYLLAQIEARAGHRDAADAAVARIRAIAPEDARVPLALAATRSARGDYRGAASALASRVAEGRQADVESGDYATMVGALGDALVHAGDRRGAVTVLDRAHARVPDDDAIHFALGAAYDEDKQYGEAERVFRDLIAADPNDARALNYLGYMLADRGEKLPEAVDFIKRALAIDRDNPAFLDSLGWAYVKLGQFDLARDPLERAAKGLPKVSVIQEHLGDLYFQLKRYADAATAFDRALAGDRDGVDAGALTKKRDRARTLTGKS